MRFSLGFLERVARAIAAAARIFGVKDHTAAGQVAAWVGKGADVARVIRTAAVQADSLQAGRTPLTKP